MKKASKTAAYDTGHREKSSRAAMKAVSMANRALDNKYKDPVVVNPEKVHRERAAMFAQNKLQAGSGLGRPGYAFPESAYHKVMLPDGKYDTDLHMRKQVMASLAKEAGEMNNNAAKGMAVPGVTPYGFVMTDADKLVGAAIEKKQMEEWLDELNFATALIDPDRPETKDYVRSMYPELESSATSKYKADMVVWMTLYGWLRDGRIGGKDDVRLLKKILSPDFELQIFPPWDPEGLIVTKPLNGDGTDKNSIYNIKTDKAWQRAMFNPKRWGSSPMDKPTYATMAETVFGAPSSTSLISEYKKHQHDWKRIIARRLLPGVKKLEDYEVDEVLLRFNPIAGAPISEEMGFYDRNNATWNKLDQASVTTREQDLGSGQWDASLAKNKQAAGPGFLGFGGP